MKTDPVTQDLKRYQSQEAESAAKDELAWSNTLYELKNMNTAATWGYLHDDDDYLLANLVNIFISEYYAITNKSFDPERVSEMKRNAVDCAIGRAIRKHIEKLTYDEQREIVDYD